MIWVLELLSIRIPAWVLAVVSTLFLAVIATQAISHHFELKTALKEQSERFVTVQEKATQEALKEAERDITTFLNKRNANNIAERERLEKIIQEFSQSASQKSQTLQDLEDEIQELLLRPSTLPTVGELRNKPTR